VVDAVRHRLFNIYAVETVDQGMELLTGVPAGEREPNGKFSEGSVNARVEARLIAFAEKRLAAAQKAQVGTES
jgi:hypothetical protein